MEKRIIVENLYTSKFYDNYVDLGVPLDIENNNDEFLYEYDLETEKINFLDPNHIVGVENYISFYGSIKPDFDLPNLEFIHGKAYRDKENKILEFSFGNWIGSAPKLREINGRKFAWKGKL